MLEQVRERRTLHCSANTHCRKFPGSHQFSKDDQSFPTKPFSADVGPEVVQIKASVKSAGQTRSQTPHLTLQFAEQSKQGLKTTNMQRLPIRPAFMVEGKVVSMQRHTQVELSFLVDRASSPATRLQLGQETLLTSKGECRDILKPAVRVHTSASYCDKSPCASPTHLPARLPGCC